jgi:flavin reductase (DIM6/NTAB) family NADH-FMN oxidoreductase RutF
MHYNKQDIADWDRILRLKIINSVTGIKPGNLIGTIGPDGTTNLAVFSSIVHLGSRPALLGFVSRPSTEEVGHTLQNIMKNGEYTINHIHPDITEQAHYTSAKFEKAVSEFDACGFDPEYIDGFKAPFVQQSHFKLGMQFTDALNISNGTKIVIGEIQHVILPDVDLNGGDLDLEQTNSVGISGLNSYYELKKIAQHPFARRDEVPKFK